MSCENCYNYVHIHVKSCMFEHDTLDVTSCYRLEFYVIAFQASCGLILLYMLNILEF